MVSAFWERGSPDLPACGLRRGSCGGPVRPTFINARLKTLARGQASRGGRHEASSGAASPGRLARRWRDQGRIPCEVLVMQAMTIKTRQVPACAVSLFPIWCKGGKHRHGVPRHPAKVAISVQRVQDQWSGRTEVTVEPKTASVRTPILSHTDLACNTSYPFAASRTVFPRVPPYLARDRSRLLAHVYDSVASIHMTKNPG